MRLQSSFLWDKKKEVIVVAKGNNALFKNICYYLVVISTVWKRDVDIVPFYLPQSLCIYLNYKFIKAVLLIRKSIQSFE